MLKIEESGEVAKIMMGREISGSVLYWVASYLVDGLLIDTGPAHVVDEFMDFLSGTEVDKIVNTHFHEDHVAANKRLKDERNIESYSHSLAIPLIGSRLPLHPYQELIWGYPDLDEPLALGDEVETERFRFEVIHTPGHSDDHVTLFERERGWAFTGDLFIKEEPRGVRPQDELVPTIASMRLLAGLEVESLTLFTSLGRTVDDGKGALARCADHLEELIARVKEKHAAGMEPSQIVTELYGEESVLSQATGGDFSIENLMRAAIRA